MELMVKEVIVGLQVIGFHSQTLLVVLMFPQLPLNMKVILAIWVMIILELLQCIYSMLTLVNLEN